MSSELSSNSPTRSLPSAVAGPGASPGVAGFGATPGSSGGRSLRGIHCELLFWSRTLAYLPWSAGDRLSQAISDIAPLGAGERAAGDRTAGAGAGDGGAGGVAGAGEG